MRVTGSLQTKRGIYQMMARVIFDDGTVKQKCKTTGLRASRKTKSEADRMLVGYLDELRSVYFYGDDQLLLTAIELWLERRKQELRLDTWESYNCTYFAHLKPWFLPKSMKLRDLTAKVLTDYVNEKLKSGLSANTVRKHLVLLNGVYKDAIRFGEVAANPVVNVVVKDKRGRFEGTAYTPETAKKLLNAIKGDPLEPAVMLGLYLGLRRSEVVGLRWIDVDFEQNVVHVRNTVVRFSTISEQEQTKNDASKRDLVLPSGLRDYLLKLQKIPGGKNSEKVYICEWPDGRPYEPNYISHRFHKILERSGLPIIRFHDLRHTAGSMLINSGQSILQVQNFLGHKKASTTLDIYSHVYLEGKRQTAAKIDELLG